MSCWLRYVSFTKEIVLLSRDVVITDRVYGKGSAIGHIRLWLYPFRFEPAGLRTGVFVDVWVSIIARLGLKVNVKSNGQRLWAW